MNDNLKYVYKIRDSYSYVDWYAKTKEKFNYYIVFDPIQFINREKSNSYDMSGSICIANPILFFRVIKETYNKEEGNVEIIKKDCIEFKNDSSYRDLKYEIDKIYDIEIKDLTIFRPEKFKFPKKENRDFKLGEILKTDIN